MNENEYKYKSLLEIALHKMEKEGKPHTLKKIAEDAFLIKGLNINENPEKLAQFQMDFMLSGHFICCGEDKNGVKFWDLKNRQETNLLDKDGSYFDDRYSDDEDVIKNELTDDKIYSAQDYQTEEERWEASDNEEEEEDELKERDEIEEELDIIENYRDDDEDEEEEEEDEIAKAIDKDFGFDDDEDK